MSFPRRIFFNETSMFAMAFEDIAVVNVDVTHCKITYNILVKKADSDRESGSFSKSLSRGYFNRVHNYSQTVVSLMARFPWLDHGKRAFLRDKICFNILFSRQFLYLFGDVN